MGSAWGTILRSHFKGQNKGHIFKRRINRPNTNIPPESDSS